MTDLLGGQLDGLFGDVPTVMAQGKAGKLKALAATSQERSEIFPEVPTLQDAGFKGLVLETWYAAFVPVGTPPSIIARLNAEIDKALADPATGKSLLQTATEPVGGSADELARIARADSEKYARLVRELNVRAN